MFRHPFASVLIGFVTLAAGLSLPAALWAQNAQDVLPAKAGDEGKFTRDRIVQGESKEARDLGFTLRASRSFVGEDHGFTKADDKVEGITRAREGGARFTAVQINSIWSCSFTVFTHPGMLKDTDDRKKGGKTLAYDGGPIFFIGKAAGQGFDRPVTAAITLAIPRPADVAAVRSATITPAFTSGVGATGSLTAAQPVKAEVARVAPDVTAPVTSNVEAGSAAVSGGGTGFVRSGVVVSP